MTISNAVTYADTLNVYGWGGGRGPDGDPLQSTPVDYKYNFGRMAADVTSAGSNPPVMRMNITAAYSGNTGSDVFSTPDWSTWDQAVGVAALTGCQLLFTVNPTSPTDPTKIPKIVSPTASISGSMTSWKNLWQQMLDRYAGPGCAIVATDTGTGAQGHGSGIVRVSWADGTHTDVDLTGMGGGDANPLLGPWPGTLYWEVWNEPNQIGACASKTNPGLAQGGSNQSLQWYQLVYMINRDALRAAKAHVSWGQFYLSAITMGGLEWDFLFGNGGSEAHGVVEYGNSRAGTDSFSWNDFHSFSMHCYVNRDQKAQQGTQGLPQADPSKMVGNRNSLDTIRSAIRPGMNTYGADQCMIWITEGGNGGSLSPHAASGGGELWNYYNRTSSLHPAVTPAGSHPGVTGPKSYSTNDVNWGHLYGDPGCDPAQASTDLNQPQMIINYLDTLRWNNTVNNAKIEMCCLHMFVRTLPMDCTVTQMGGLSGTGSNYIAADWVFVAATPTVPAHWAIADTKADYVYWQLGRCFSEMPGCDTDRNQYRAASSNGYTLGASASYGSPDWLPVASAYYQEILSTVGGVPVNSTLPTINNTTPTQGDILTASPGTWTNTPNNYSFIWNRDGVAITGATCANTNTCTYQTGSSDVGHAITVSVVAHNTSGNSLSATSTATSNVLAPTAGVPVNSVIPALSGANPPVAGSTQTSSTGTWSNSPTGYTYAWERMDKNGNITSI